jgi:hypothetical protein
MADIKQQIADTLQTLETSLTDGWRCEQALVTAFRALAVQHLAGQPASPAEWAEWLTTINRSEKLRDLQRASATLAIGLMPALVRALEAIPAVDAAPVITPTPIGDGETLH